MKHVKQQKTVVVTGSTKGIGKAQEHIHHVSVPDESFEEILSQCATGIATCDTLSDNGGHDEIVLAIHIVETYCQYYKLSFTLHHRILSRPLP